MTAGRRVQPDRVCGHPSILGSTSFKGEVIPNFHSGGNRGIEQDVVEDFAVVDQCPTHTVNGQRRLFREGSHPGPC